MYMYTQYNTYILMLSPLSIQKQLGAGNVNTTVIYLMSFLHFLER